MTDDASAFDERYYADIYRDYHRQNPSYKLAYYRRLIGRTPGRILDIGCAFGTFLASLPETWDRSGTDLSHYAISHPADPALRLQVASAAEIPGGPYDVITAFDVLEHVHAIDDTREAIVNALRPGGVLVMVVPVYDGASGPLIRALDPDPTHVHTWPRERWLEWVRTRLTIECWEGILRWLVPGVGYLHVPTRRFRQHVPAISIVARKPFVR